MKILILYRPNSEYGRLVEEFVHDFRSRYADKPLEVLDIDSRDGGAAASLYDVVQFPAILVVQDDGNIQRSWEGETLPLIDEVVAYARA